MDNQNNDPHEGNSGENANPVYVQTQTRRPLKRIYFYKSRDGTREIESYFLKMPPIAHEDIPAKINDILQEIANSQIQAANSIRYIPWEGDSYFILYYEGKLKQDNAVTFNFCEPGESAPFCTGGNHTFRDGADEQLPGGVSLFYCINHMEKRGGGSWREKERERFQVTLNHDDGGPGQEAAASAAPESIVTHTDTGTNTGPP